MANRFAPKVETKTSTKKEVDAVEEIINAQKRKEKMQEAEGDIHRVNFNMPKYLYELSREKTVKKGMTLTNYILGLIRKDLGEE
jgi:hypothetical protein